MISLITTGDSWAATQLIATINSIFIVSIQVPWSPGKKIPESKNFHRRLNLRSEEEGNVKAVASS